MFPFNQAEPSCGFPQTQDDQHLNENLQLNSGKWKSALSSKLPVLVSAAAGNKSATRPPLPLLACGGEWKETGRNWRVGIRAV